MRAVVTKSFERPSQWHEHSPFTNRIDLINFVNAFNKNSTIAIKRKRNNNSVKKNNSNERKDEHRELECIRRNCRTIGKISCLFISRCCWWIVCVSVLTSLCLFIYECVILLLLFCIVFIVHTEQNWTLTHITASVTHYSGEAFEIWLHTFVASNQYDESIELKVEEKKRRQLVLLSTKNIHK